MEPPVPGSSKHSQGTPAAATLFRNRNTRGRKRKRSSSDSSSDTEVLPENTLEVEKSLHASAVKNNLDDVSVKKILKKVVTNDHVLALVKLREEEEDKATKVENLQPKLTRAKVKELMKVSPKTGHWNLENLALTPIKHIPVKTRPEVKALIAQELHADEDDDEYQPTNEDVPSDDDHTLESCSDADSQPRTPATPRRHPSPRVLRDGPFKVPQEISTPRRKLDMDEDATIALRTRSKLSLSSIPIDHIESSFVPPDELPMPVVDDIWTEFLQECMNPETSKNEDDEDDPEYNVAADPDANDEDEEGLENIMKISKKELNDLVTELFNIMPEDTTEDVLSGELASEVPAQNSTTTQPAQWEGKQEPLSDDETAIQRPKLVERRAERVSIGKCEPLSDTEAQDAEGEQNVSPIKTRVTPLVAAAASPANKPVTLSLVEGTAEGQPGADAPPPLRHLLVTSTKLTVHVEQGVKMLPEQIQILQQQLRQHIQLAASNFLQLFVHPVHWALAPTYRDYLELMDKMASKKPDSVVNVCNLRPALALIRSWQESMSADTPENTSMVDFVHKEVERARRRASQNSLYVGNFHETFLEVVSNSPVFLYPHLLPPMPFRSDIGKRFNYLRSEDELIALGIDEFWQYVEDNPDMYKIRTIQTKHRWGLVTAVQLLCKHMLPWMPPKALLCHIQHVRKSKDKDNPIIKFFATREVTPVKHELLPFNPKLTLYEQPEHEMPRIWVRHLAKSSRRFHNHYYRRTGLNKLIGSTPAGVPIDLCAAVEPPKKNPLPINFTQEIVPTRLNLLPPIAPKPPTYDKFDIEITPAVMPSTAPPVLPTLYSVVQTPSGAYLIPLSMVTTNSASTPISSSEVQETVANNLPEESNVPIIPPPTIDHCSCCILLRKICRERQTLMTDFFTPRTRTCPCKEKRKAKYPKITRKLRLLVNSYKSKSYCAWQGLQCRVESLTEELKRGEGKSLSAAVQYDLEEIAAVTSFQLKLTMRTAIARNNYMKRKVHALLSRFKPDADDIYVLMGDMDKALEAECVDVYKEMLGFLTPEQADKMGRFLDYFKQECLTDLMKRIDDEVPNRHHKLNILIKLRLLVDTKLNPCDVCASLLQVLKKYPKLASHVFSLFPHRKDKVDGRKAVETFKPVETATTEGLLNNAEEEDDEDIDETEANDNLEHEKSTCNASQAVDMDGELDDTIYDESQPIDYEADNSESDDEGSFENNLTIVEEPDEINNTDVERIDRNNGSSENVIDTPQLTVTKTEVQDYPQTDMSMMIMSDEDAVKSEPAEWKREEDKLLLEILKQSLTPEERKDRTILEILEEKNVLQLVAESLSHKSIEDVRERMIYLLKLIVLNNE